MIGPFIGRERELAQVARGLTQVVEGRGNVFLLTGEPGIGKTRLADAIARDAAGRGLRVAWARCWEGEGAPAYWPWIQMLEELGEALPERPPATTDAADARFTFFTAVTARLTDIARRAPLLLVLDDLHVADVSSLLLLQFVARAIRAIPIGIVGTYRESDARTAPDAERTLVAIAREAAYLPLHRFNNGEIAAYAEQLDVEMSAAHLAEVARVTEGNPLFVDHVLRTSPRFAVPPTLRAALRDRLAQISDPAARELLAIIAVAGREAELATVARVEGVPAATAAELLAPAVSAGVLEPIVKAARFTHVLLRDELYATLSADRRAALHAALVDALDPSDALTAHHALAGVAVIGADRAVATVTRAAARSLAMLAFEDAAGAPDPGRSSRRDRRGGPLFILGGARAVPRCRDGLHPKELNAFPNRDIRLIARKRRLRSLRRTRPGRADAARSQSLGCSCRADDHLAQAVGASPECRGARSEDERRSQRGVTLTTSPSRLSTSKPVSTATT